MTLSDEDLRQIWTDTSVIACIGASPNPARPSHYVSQYLRGRGYRVIPVNPGQAGAQMFGETVVATIADLPAEVEMIDVFRNSAHVAGVVEAALTHLPALRTIWTQLGVRDDEAAAKARARGIRVVQNRCPMIEIPRLFGPGSL
ncbi:CoA-binding protein [Fluviibacterium sp. DFM31]|uniref:CoA-binding protein n=1 Tax=Meridianimarinicoccus marinus TaxID=3231483 RepID=A0ABV3L266_9RHOB